jgi:hypothetical protein
LADDRGTAELEVDADAAAEGSDGAAA